MVEPDLTRVHIERPAALRCARLHEVNARNPHATRTRHPFSIPVPFKAHVGVVDALGLLAVHATERNHVEVTPPRQRPQ